MIKLLQKLSLQLVVVLFMSPLALTQADDRPAEFDLVMQGYLFAEYDQPNRAAPLLFKVARTIGDLRLYEAAAEQAILTNDLVLMGAIGGEWYSEGGGIQALRFYTSVVIRRSGYSKASQLLTTLVNEGGSQEVYRTISSVLPRLRDPNQIINTIEAYSAAHSQANKNADYWAYLSLLLVYGGNLSEATEALDYATKIDNNSVPVMLASMLVVEGQSGTEKQRTEIAYELAAVLGSSVSEALDIYWHWRSDYQRSFAPFPSNPANYGTRYTAEQKRLRAASFLSVNGAPQQGLEELGQIDYRSPNFDRNLQVRIKILETLNREVEIDRLLNEAITEVASEHKLPIVQLIANRLEKIDGATAAYEYLAELNSNDRKIIDLTAVYADRAGYLEEAEILLRKLIEESPDDSTPLNTLGYLLADNNRKLGEAEELLKRAIELEPNDPAIIDSYGWLLFRLGRFSEALQYIKQSKAIFEKTQSNVVPGEIMAHLGEIYWALGERARAIAVWQEGYRNTPEDKVLLETIQRYEVFDI